MTPAMIPAVTVALTLALVTVLGIALAPLVLAPLDPDTAVLNAVTAQAWRERDWRILRDYRNDTRAAPPRRPGQARPASPVAVPDEGPSPVHSPAPPGEGPLAPRGRHHAGQPRQPWLTAPMPAVPAVETEPLPEPEEYICEPWQAVPGFYRHHERQQYRRLS